MHEQNEKLNCLKISNPRTEDMTERLNKKLQYQTRPKEERICELKERLCEIIQPEK